MRTKCTRSSVVSALKVAFATRARLLPTRFRKSLTLGLATAMATDTSVVRKVGPLGFPYQTVDPFLFCVYHYDDYPEGDNAMRAPRRGDGSVRAAGVDRGTSRHPAPCGRAWVRGTEHARPRNDYPASRLRAARAPC